MTKRYREDLEEVETEEGEDGVRPTAFRWRGHRYRVTSVLGHWREDPGWWRRPSGEPIRIEQSDLFRVEAAGGRVAGGVEAAGGRVAGGVGAAGGRVAGGVGAAGGRVAEDVEACNGAPVPGVYELVRCGEQWRLDRVWD